MSIFITIVVFLLIFSVLILIHEVGHFVMAKRAGILVEEFGFGLPPRLFGKKIGETLYSFNLIPFGGFVRMLGEDARDPELLRKKRSFIAKPLRARILVVIAGVVMNAFLAIVLLTIGFSIGIEPLIVTGDDMMDNIKKGVVEVAPASEKSADLKNIIRLPRVAVKDVLFGSPARVAGLQKDDLILTINGQTVFFIEEVQQMLEKASLVSLKLFRGGVERDISFLQPKRHTVVVSELIEGSPAFIAGFQSGDIIIEANGIDIRNPKVLTDVIQGKKGQEIVFAVERSNANVTLRAAPSEDGRIGVVLTKLFAPENLIGTMYETTAPVMIAKVHPVRLPIHKAVIASFQESFRLSKLTVVMFGKVITSVVQHFKVPDGVAGPVGIARLTHVFVQEGAMAVLRFVALLSLSLAVINILPLPALDGGRLLFLFGELIVGRRMNARFESAIHAAGYALLILLIILVTYSDVVKLFVAQT